MTEPVLVSLYELLEAQRRRGTGDGGRFDPSSSPLHERMIFIVGAPRSGTTWLHQMLSTHPDVATGGETHLFCEGFGDLLDNHADPDPHMKLSTWVTRTELLDMMRRLADGIFTTARDAVRPGASRVLDKTPNHVLHAARVAAVYPDAAFVHIIRDGRDVTGSTHDLWGWNERWGAYEHAAAVWRDAVRDVREHLAGLRYVEVRYEDLVDDTTSRFGVVLDFLGLDHDDEFVRRVVEFGRTPVNVRPSDSRTGVRKWAHLDADAERQIVEAAGDLLVDLGYLTRAERDRILTTRTAASVARTTRRAVGRAVRGGLDAVRERMGADARNRRARERVRAGARALATALGAGDLDAAGTHTVRDLVLRLADGAVLHGDEALRRLRDLAAGSDLIALDADEDAAAVRWADEHRQQLHTYEVDARGRVSRVTVRG